MIASFNKFFISNKLLLKYVTNKEVISSVLFVSKIVNQEISTICEHVQFIAILTARQFSVPSAKEFVQVGVPV